MDVVALSAAIPGPEFVPDLVMVTGSDLMSSSTHSLSEHDEFPACQSWGAFGSRGKATRTLVACVQNYAIDT